MALDTRIPLQTQMPDFAGIYADTLNARETNMLAAQQQEKAAMATQQKNRLVQVYSQAVDPQTGAVDRNMLLKGLAGAGRGELIPTLQTEFAQQDKAQAEASQKKLEFNILNTRTAREEVARAMGKNDAVDVARRFVANGAIDPETASSIVQSIPDDPKQFPVWQRDFTSRLLTAEKRMEFQIRQRQTAVQEGQLDLSERRLRAIQSRPAAGAVMTPTAGAAPGGPQAAPLKPLTAAQEQKIRANIAKDFKATQGALDEVYAPTSGLLAAGNAVRKLSRSQKEAVTGWSGKFPTVTEKTFQADTAIKNLKGKVTAMGKAIAAATGAIGSMAKDEWKILSDMVAAFDPTEMGADDLNNQVAIIESQAKKTAELMQRAYEDQYREEFGRYPDRFKLRVPGSVSTNKDVDANNPLLR
jgi:hypothetical protein